MRAPGTARKMKEQTMKTDMMGLLRNAAIGLKRKDPVTAYALLELGNNLRKVMRCENSLGEFCRVYVGQDREAFVIDDILPPPPKG
jgi:hypothetical protein